MLSESTNVSQHQQLVLIAVSGHMGNQSTPTVVDGFFFFFLVMADGFDFCVLDVSKQSADTSGLTKEFFEYSVSACFLVLYIYCQILARVDQKGGVEE